jgi:hypothetical protein
LEKVMDWRDFRIPAADRRAVVIRYYMIKLLRRKTRQESVRHTVAQKIKFQKEMAIYLNSYGAVNVEIAVDAVDHVEELDQNSGGMHDFWYFPEDVILDTISCCAQALQRKAPFNEHPANKSKVLPEKVFDEFCRVPRRLGKEVRQALQAEIRGAANHARSSFLRRQCLFERPESKLPSCEDEEASKETGELMKSAPPDLDDLWNRFTPREQKWGFTKEARDRSPVMRGGRKEEVDVQESGGFWMDVPDFKNAERQCS